MNPTADTGMDTHGEDATNLHSKLLTALSSFKQSNSISEIEIAGILFRLATEVSQNVTRRDERYLPVLLHYDASDRGEALKTKRRPMTRPESDELYRLLSDVISESCGPPPVDLRWETEIDITISEIVGILVAMATQASIRYTQ